MNVPASMKPHILKEFDFVFSKLEEPINLEEIVYYYSALYGAVYRVMNIECTPDLVFLHHTLNHVHTAFATRFQAMSKAGERPVIIDEKMVARLTELTGSLYNQIQNDQDSTETCKSLLNLAYATTGNGYYLYQKNELVI